MLSRRFMGVFAIAAVALIAGVVFGTLVPGSEAAPAAQQPVVSLSRTLTVVGRGEVTSKPDIANTTLGVETASPTIDQAMDDAKARMDAILTALKELGIADKDIQTSNFSINFERQQPGIPMPATGATPDPKTPTAGVYRVSNMVQVKIRDLDETSNVLDAAVKAGANNVWGLNFGLDQPKALEADARELAIKDALARAESLAELTGVTVGDVVSVSEIVGNVGGPMFAEAAKGLGGGGGTPVEPGEVSFSTQIQVVYAIE